MPWTNPETFTAGQTLTAASMNLISGNLTALPRGYVIGSKKTSNQGSISTITDLTSLSVTFTMESGRWYRVSVQCDVAPTVNTDTAVLSLADGSNNELMRSVLPWHSNSNSLTGVIIYFEQAASSGPVTRKARLARVAGTGTMEAQAASTRPALILVEDMGAP